MLNIEYDFNNCVERINSDSAKWDGVFCKFGKPVLPMWIADMDFPAAECIRSALENRLCHPVYGYPEHDDSVQKAAATWLQLRHQWRPNPEDILLIQGVVPALYAAVRAFSEPGESVIVMPPIYPPFMDAIKENNRHLESVNLLSDASGFYTIDFDRLEKAMHQSKLLMFCSPHNPVGRTWTKAEISHIVDLAKKNDVIIVSDEIHADLSFDNFPHTPLPLLDENSIFLGAASKSFNIAGIGGGIAWVGDHILRKRFSQELGQSCNLGMNIFAKVASKAAWRDGFEWQAALRSYFMGNAQHIHERLSANLPHIIYHIPQGSYLAWLNLRALGMTDLEIEKRLLNAGLGLNLGPSFGKNGSGYVRLNFGTPRKLLDQGLTLLERALLF